MGERLREVVEVVKSLERRVAALERKEEESKPPVQQSEGIIRKITQRR